MKKRVIVSGTGARTKIQDLSEFGYELSSEHLRLASGGVGKQPGGGGGGTCCCGADTCAPNGCYDICYWCD